MVRPTHAFSPRNGQWLPAPSFFWILLWTVFGAIIGTTDVYAQCTCTFTPATSGNWNTITWNKSGTCGSNTLPGPNDCVTIPDNRTVTISGGIIINIRGLTVDGNSAVLNVEGLGTRLNIGPGNPSNPNNVSLRIDSKGSINIKQSAVVSVIGNWWNGNNGNIVTDGNTQGFFEVSNCVSIGGSINNVAIGNTPPNSCNLNTGVLAPTLTFCVRCPSCIPNNNNPTFSNGAFQSTNGCGIINALNPINLVSFDASVEHQEVSGEPFVALRWVTASETDNDFFSIERSADGENFTEILRIPGAGNSNTTIVYAAADKSPLNGINYYRLKQTDFDGTFSYSKVVAVYVNLSPAARLAVYPNPNKGEELFFNMSRSDIKSLAVYDLSGRLQEYCTEFEQTPNGLKPLIKGLLNKGSYLLKVTFADEQTAMRKFLVQ